MDFRAASLGVLHLDWLEHLNLLRILFEWIFGSYWFEMVVRFHLAKVDVDVMNHHFRFFIKTRNLHFGRRNILKSLVRLKNYQYLSSSVQDALSKRFILNLSDCFRKKVGQEIYLKRILELVLIEMI